MCDTRFVPESRPVLAGGDTRGLTDSAGRRWGWGPEKTQGQLCWVALRRPRPAEHTRQEKVPSPLNAGQVAHRPNPSRTSLYPWGALHSLLGYLVPPPRQALPPSGICTGLSLQPALLMSASGLSPRKATPDNPIQSTPTTPQPIA